MASDNLTNQAEEDRHETVSPIASPASVPTRSAIETYVRFERTDRGLLGVLQQPANEKVLSFEYDANWPVGIHR